MIHLHLKDSFQSKGLWRHRRNLHLCWDDMHWCVTGYVYRSIKGLINDLIDFSADKLRLGHLILNCNCESLLKIAVLMGERSLSEVTDLLISWVQTLKYPALVTIDFEHKLSCLECHLIYTKWVACWVSWLYGIFVRYDTLKRVTSGQ